MYSNSQSAYQEHRDRNTEGILTSPLMHLKQFLFEVTISMEKIFYIEKKSIVLYSSTHTLCGFMVKVGAKRIC